MAKQHIIFLPYRNPEKKQLSRDLRRQMTRAEKIIWNQLRGHRLCNLHFRRQVLIGPFIVDFYCHKEKLVVEIDGEVHDKEKEMDIERDIFLGSLGLRVLRISNSLVFYDLPLAMEQIESICKDHPTPDPSP